MNTSAYKSFPNQIPTLLFWACFSLLGFLEIIALYGAQSFTSIVPFFICGVLQFFLGNFMFHFETKKDKRVNLRYIWGLACLSIAFVSLAGTSWPPQEDILHVFVPIIKVLNIIVLIISLVYGLFLIPKD